MNQELLDKVYRVIELYNRPVTTKDISLEMNLSFATTVNAMKQLVEAGKLVMLTSDNPDETKRVKYYSIFSEKTDKVMEQKFATLDSALAQQKDETDKRLNELETATKSLYANMISIMGIFVAIFSLIVLNAEAIQHWLPTGMLFKDAFLKMLALNIPVVFAIIILLLAVRLIILRDFKRGDHK